MRTNQLAVTSEQLARVLELYCDEDYTPVEEHHLNRIFSQHPELKDAKGRIHLVKLFGYLVKRAQKQGKLKVGDKNPTTLVSQTKTLALTDDQFQPEADSYEYHKDKMAKKSRKKSATARDIGPIPPVVDEGRRERCRLNLKAFLKTYFGSEHGKFYMEWSPDHETVIHKLERSILNGDLFALAMPRGSGKTTIMTMAALWAIIYGHRKYVVVIGDGSDASKEIMDDIKTELDNNELLTEDFPEVCVPIQALEGIANRCRGQTCEGVRTNIKWADTKIILPTTEVNKLSSGSIITSVGILGRIRGMKHTLPSGTALRPDLALIDDPQNNESATSPGQNRKRLKIMSGAVLGLAGPGKKIAGLMACTVIAKNDLADQLLNRHMNPAWQGERISMLKSMPENMELWNKYSEIRIDSLRRHADISKATEFYQANREAMDKGAKPYWEQRFVKGEISAIQHAMNLYFHDPEAFASEYQNEPIDDTASNADKLTIEHIFAKINNRPQFEIPLNSHLLATYIDVQKTCLYYTTVAFDESYNAHVIDYGTYPDQHRRYFTLKDIKNTFDIAYPTLGLQAQIYQALGDLTKELQDRTYRREDNSIIPIDIIMVDTAWGRSTDVIFKFIKESSQIGTIIPARGMAIQPTATPIAEYVKKPGERIGESWIFRRGTRPLRHLAYDTYYWKSFVRDRILTAKADTSTCTLFGEAWDIERHRMFAEQLSAEYSVTAEAKGRKVDVWSVYPGRDNHFFDCLVGCHVAASFKGTKLTLGETSVKSRKPLQQALPKQRKHISIGQRAF